MLVESRPTALPAGPDTRPAGASGGAGGEQRGDSVGCFVCPVCDAAELTGGQAPDSLSCQQCAARYPISRARETGIPWLFADPLGATLQWKARYNGFLHRNSLDLERLRQARGQATKGSAGHARINTLLQARERYRNQLIDLMSPFGLEHIDWPADATDLLCERVPAGQGLVGYVTNVFRDWSWDNGENDVAIELIDNLLGCDSGIEMGALLTLGAGACRLTYDMHRRYRPDSTTVLDLNPMLLQLAAHIIQGDEVALYEFPLAPANSSDIAVLQRCRAPEPLPADAMQFVLGDAVNPPFGERQFDTVVTPWLIDIISHDLRVLVQRINRCLSDGGVWLNTGSLAFFHRNELWRYSEEEVRQLIESQGFEVLAWERRSIPYLQSPYSAQKRFESVLSFTARKVADVPTPDRSHYLPEWLLDTSLPVPAVNVAAIASSNYLLKSQVLASVDGRQTINQIGRNLARQYGLGKPETIHAVRQVLLDEWERLLSQSADTDL